MPKTPANTLLWQQECIYIARVTDVRGNVPEMNHDCATFVRYCEMQRDAATREGFHDSAQYIQHCIDDLTAAKEG
jgi:hypothetical protein